MAKDNPAAFFEALRRSSAKQLKLDPDNLTAAEATRVDRVCALRVCLDRMTSAQLAGAELDARSYIAASQELELLLGGNPKERHYASGARNKLMALFERVMEGADGDTAPAAAVSAEEAAEPDQGHDFSGAREDIVPAYDPAAKAELALTDGRAHEPPITELMPEGQDPPTSNAHVTYVDAGVLDDPSPLRTHSLNNAAGQSRPPTQRPSSPVTAAYLGTGGALNCGGSPWATKNWSPRRY